MLCARSSQPINCCISIFYLKRWKRNTKHGDDCFKKVDASTLGNFCKCLLRISYPKSLVIHYSSMNGFFPIKKNCFKKVKLRVKKNSSEY